MMSAKKHGDNFIFDFERPATPTGIRGSFSQSAHAPLIATDSLDDGEYQLQTPPPQTTSPAHHSLVRQDKDSSESHAKDDSKLVSFFIEDFDELTSEEQLPLAQERIQFLEKRLDVVERELRLSQERTRKLAAQGSRLRRPARSGDLFRRSQTSVENNIGKHWPLYRFTALFKT